MSPRRTLTVAALVGVLPIAAACGAGKGNETSKEHATPYIPQARVGDLLVTNAALVPSGSTTTVGASPSPTSSSSTSSSSTGTPSSGADGYLLVTIANSGTSGDTLTGVSISTAQVTPAGGSASSLDIAPQSVVQFGDPELGSSGPALRVSNVQTPVNVGQSVSVTFTFRNAGSATVNVPVRASDDLGTTESSVPLNFTGSYPSPTESVPAPESSPQVSTTSTP